MNMIAARYTLLKLRPTLNLSILFVCIACSDDRPLVCNTGDEGCSCDDAGVCGDGLTCNLGTCVSAGDGDVDGDGDSDSDTDSDDTAACYESADTLAIKADENDWIDECTNKLGIQGFWYTYDDDTSVIEKTNPGNGGMCASGNVPAQADGIWGAGLGFDICRDSEEDNGQTFGISDCPKDLSSLIGVKLTVTGALPSSELRVTFSEVDRDQSAYIVPVSVDRAATYLFEDAEVSYSPSAPPIDPSKIRAIQFQVAAKSGSAVPFDFCIEDIEAVVSASADGDADADSDADADADADADVKFVGNITTQGQVWNRFMEYWDQITPENEGKWGSIEGTRDQMSWANLQRVYNFAKQNNIPFKQHTLVWGSQFPQWINSLSASEQAQEIEEWISEFCKKFPDTDMIDVVNEAVSSHAPANFAKNAFGNDWIIRSFELAHQYCPDAILILNDYNVLRWQTEEFVALATPVIQNGIVDAVGCQAHSLGGHDGQPVQATSELKANLDRIASLGVDVYISEYDIEQTDDQAQLQVMKDQFPIFYEHPSVKGITYWGVVVNTTWRAGTGLVNTDGTERPALQWLMEYLGR